MYKVSFMVVAEYEGETNWQIDGVELPIPPAVGMTVSLWEESVAIEDIHITADRVIVVVDRIPFNPENAKQLGWYKA